MYLHILLQFVKGSRRREEMEMLALFLITSRCSGKRMHSRSMLRSPSWDLKTWSL